MDIDDLYITDTGICGSPRSSSMDPPTTMSTAIHVFRLRCLWAKIHTSLYSDTTLSSPDSSTYPRTEQIRTELEEWLASAPPIAPRTGDALSIFASRDWYDVNYNYCILLIYRGQLTDNSVVSEKVFMECLKAAENICQGYRRQYIGKSVNYTWGALHFLFMAGLTYLHCLWTSPAARKAVRYDKLSNTCTDCTIVLVVMAERWEGAAPYLEIFEALASRTTTMMVDESHERCTPPNPSTISDDVDSVNLTQWMADISNTGMSDGVDSLLSGLIGDFRA
jgi:hypothetical protein